MSADWQVGDLALCVDDTPRYAGHRVLVENGKTYRVTGFSTVNGGRPALFLGGVIGWLPGEEKAWPYQADRFRKIRPDEREACEPEFVTLLNRMKEPSHA